MDRDNMTALASGVGSVIFVAIAVLVIILICKWVNTPNNNLRKDGSIIINSLKWGHMQITASLLGATEVMMDNPDNWVGGVDIRVIFTNNTSKIIKYVTFTFGAENAVGDRVECTTRHSLTSDGKFTGPLNPAAHSSEQLVFRTMFYNSSIKKIGRASCRERV